MTIAFVKVNNHNVFDLTRDGSTVVEHLPQCLKVKGSSTAPAAGTGIVKMANSRLVYKLKF
jgi:hypothetical protein